MDFENYTLRRLAEGRGNYDFKHPAYRKIRAQILWRVQELGWTAERFQKVDRLIEERYSSYSRAGDEHQKVDRYGKKYSWIAYFELRGYLEDQRLLKLNEEFGRTSDVDIDPSFPSPTPEVKLITDDFLGRSSLSLKEWIKNGPVPNISHYFRQPKILGELGPWTMLDGYLAQEDASRGRRMFAFVRSFLVAKKEAKAFKARLTGQPLGGRWLPEKPRLIYTFTGEMPWSNTFPDIGETELAFPVATRKVKMKRKQSYFSLDGRELTLTLVDIMRLRVFGKDAVGDTVAESLTSEELSRIEQRYRIVEVEEDEKALSKFRAFIPIIDLSWEGRNVEDLPISGIGLAKQLAVAAHLINIPQTHDLQTHTGVRATYGIAFQRQNFHNSERFFFIRDETLRALLRERNCSLIWAMWGERELSYNLLEPARPHPDLPEQKYANFQNIFHY